MSKFIRKVKHAVSFRSTRSSLSRAGSNIEVDPPSPAASGSSSRSTLAERNVLLQDKQLKLRDDREKEI
jgi:hypothetical protein